MKIELEYGRDGLEVDLPKGARPTIITKPKMTLPEDPHIEIRRAIDNPIGSETLEAIAEGAKSACILICDITRPVPNHLFLRPLIERLTRAGVPLDGITVLVATGLHRPNLGAELA